MKGLALFMMVIPFVRYSQDGPLQAVHWTPVKGTLSQYLAPRMLVKTRYQNIFFFHSYPYNLLIIHHLHLCFFFFV